MILLVGCGSDWEAEEEVETEPVPSVVEIIPEAGWNGEAVSGWEPWGVAWDLGDGSAPVILREDGFQAPLAPVDNETPPKVFAPLPLIPVGTHAGSAGEESFEVVIGEWGQVDAFEPDTLDGRSWALQSLTWANAGTQDAVLSLLRSYGLTLHVVDARPGEADVELWATQGEACRVFAGTATLGEGGLVSWKADEVEVPSEPESFRVWNLSFRGGADADGATVAGVELRAVVDLGPISAAGTEAGDEQRLCDYVYGLGGCDTCPDGSSETCFDIGIYGGRFDESSFSRPEEPAACGVDFTGTVPELGCDADLDLDFDLCSLGALPLFGVGLSAALRRRRRG